MILRQCQLSFFLFSFQWVTYLIHHSMAKDNLKINWLHHSDKELFRGLLQFWDIFLSVNTDCEKTSANYLGKSRLYSKLLDSRTQSILSLGSKLRSCLKSPYWDKQNFGLWISNPVPRQKILKWEYERYERHSGIVNSIKQPDLGFCCMEYAEMFSCVNRKNEFTSWKEWFHTFKASDFEWLLADTDNAHFLILHIFDFSHFSVITKDGIRLKNSQMCVHKHTCRHPFVQQAEIFSWLHCIIYPLYSV